MSTIPVHFHWSDCDAAGVAYYPRIIERLHEALETWFAGHGILFAECVRDGLGLPTVSLKTEFSRPCTMGDECSVSVQPVKAGRSSMTLRLVLAGPDGRPRVTAEQVIVAIDRAAGRPAEIPAAIRALFPA